MNWLTMALAASLATQPAAGNPKQVNLYLMFFVRGDADRSKYSKEQLDKMQADHVGNIGAQHKAGKVLAAGPLDENLPVRGIVVLKAKDMEELRACFTEDPFVRDGLLKIRAWKWHVPDGVFQKPHEPYELGRFTLGVALQGDGFSPKSWSRHARSLEALRKNGDLAIAGSIDGGEDGIGVYIFRQTDQDKIRAALAEDPEIKAFRIKLKLYKLLMARDTLVPAK